MRRRRRTSWRHPARLKSWLAAVWLGGILAGAASAQPLPAGAENCLAAMADAASAAAAGDEPVYYAIDYCPTFAALLAASPWAANVPIDTDYLGPGAIGELVDLTARYENAIRPGTLAIDRLNAIVAELEPFVAEPEPSIWERIGEWIQGWFERGDGEQTWLGRWLSSLSIPDSWIRPIMYTIAGLTVLTVLLIVVNELRLGGAFVGRTTRALRSAIAGRAAADVPPPTLESIRTEANLGRKVELMFSLVLDRMRQRYDGLSRTSLTHRELAHAAAGLDTEARAELSKLAGAAERVTYADWDPDEESLQHVLDSGESLVRRIEDGDGAPA